MNNGAPCPNCNTTNPYTSTFCSKCGHKLPWADAITGQQQSPAPAPFFAAPVAPTPQASKPIKNPTPKWQLWALGLALGFCGMGWLVGSRAIQVEEAKQAAYRKSPVYLAKVKAEQERVRLARKQASVLASQKRRAAAAKVADQKAQEGKAQKDEIKIVEQNAKSIEKILRDANGTSDGEMFSGYSVDDGDKLTLTTTSTFDALPYRSRLQMATLLYTHWGNLCERTANHKTPLFHMNDIAGNEVGGRGVLSGAWVVEQ